MTPTTDIKKETPESGPPEPAGGESTRMPFRTPARDVLTPQRERDMAHEMLMAVEQLERDLGRGNRAQAFSTRNGRPTINDSFMGKRHRYQMESEDKFAWRRQEGTVFMESNFSVNMARRWARQMIARNNIYFFGTDPWFDVRLVDFEDTQLERDDRRFVGDSFLEAAIKDGGRAISETTFTMGEAVVKPTYAREFTRFRDQGQSLKDADGRDMLAADGFPITELDEWLTAKDGRQILKRDGRTEMPVSPIWVPGVVTKTLVVFEGPRIDTIPFHDFLCGTTEKSTDSAEMVAHVYEERASSLWSRLSKELSEAEAPAVNAFFKWLVNHQDDSVPVQSEGMRAENERGEAAPAKIFRGEDPILSLAEVYARWDIDGDGLPEEVIVIIDRKTKEPIWYDYLAPYTPDGRRPFKVNRINPVRNRWYGLGCYEMFENPQAFIETVFNRINAREGRAGRVDFWDPDAVETNGTNDLVLNWGNSYKLRRGRTVGEALQTVQLPEYSKGLYQMMEFVLQAKQLETGIVSAGDQKMAGLPASELATGLMQMEKSGQELFSLHIDDQFRSLSEILEIAAKHLFRNTPTAVLEGYYSGAIAEGSIDDVARVPSLRRKIQPNLGQYYNDAMVQKLSAAVDKGIAYFTLPPAIQEKLADPVRKMFRLLGVEDSEKIIVPMQLQAPEEQLALPPPSQDAGASPGTPAQSTGQVG